VDSDGVRGVTSNPSIFEKAIGGSNEYDEAVSALLSDATARQAISMKRLLWRISSAPLTHSIRFTMN
jgi:transaldolase